MKKYLYFAVFNIIILSFYGCKKDDDSDLQGLYPQSEKIVSIAGIVQDEDGMALAGVEVKMGNSIQISDADGVFLFLGKSVPSNRYFISTTKTGYFNSGYGGIPITGKMSYVRISMLKLDNPQNLDAQTGGIVSIPGEFQITFPADAFQTAAGLNYSGPVKVYTRFLTPDAVGYGQNLPGGDFAALNGENRQVPMTSIGMIGVVITDAGNEELKLANGINAEIKVSISASSISTAPATIPLMTFDPVSGIWKQEGSAVKSGTDYIGLVSHFSWWSCSLLSNSNPPIIIGKVKDCLGNGVPFATVTFNGQYTRITDNQGFYYGWVPTGITVTIQVTMMNNFGTVGSNSNVITLQPISGHNTVQDLIVDCPSKISGTILCSGSPAAAFLRISFPGNSGYVLSVFGQFTASVPNNEIIYLKTFIYPSSHDTSCYSGNQGSVTSIGNIQFCHSSIPGSCGSGLDFVSDIDGNNYNIIKIGNQCWMRENLKTTRYKNGQPIATGLSDNDWSTTTFGAYAIYDNLPFNNSIFGKLYNFYAVADTNGLCPTGWHVPTNTDWFELTKFLDPAADSTAAPNVGESMIAGEMMKSTGLLSDGTGLWLNGLLDATNSSGFSAIPAGQRSPNGSFYGINTHSYFWSSTSLSASHAMMRFPHMNLPNLFKSSAMKGLGYPVRCVKD